MTYPKHKRPRKSTIAAAFLALLTTASPSSVAQAETVDIPVPKAVVSTAFNAALSSTRVYLHNIGPKHETSWHKDSSYILLPGGSKKDFKLNEETFKVTKWRKLRHYVSDLQTSHIQTAINSDRIETTAFFESQGEEVKAKCIRRRLGKWKECSLNIERDIHLNNARMVLSFKPVAYKGSIAFGSASALFKTDIKIANRLCNTFSGICGWIEGKIKREMTRQIEGSVRAGLNSTAVKDAVANAVRNAAGYRNIIDPAWTVTKVVSSGSNYIVTVNRPDQINASSVKSVKLVAAKKKVKASCPVKLKLNATIRTKHAVKGKAWLRYENGKKSEKLNWKAGKNKTITSPVYRTFKAKAGKTKKGWAVMHLSYEGSNGKTYKKKSNKAKFRVSCLKTAGVGFTSN